jgi:KDO2-lipid IV(A) lauroyltransferase
LARSVFARHRDHAPPHPAVAATVRVLEMLAARAFWGLCALLPVARASALGAALLRRVGPRLPKQRHVETNLARVLPEATAAERARVARAVWGNLGAVMAEYPHLRRIVDERVEVRFDPGVRELLRRDGPRVFCAAHLANWELAAAQIVALGVPLTVVYARANDARIDALLDRYRRQLGCTLVEKRDSARELMATLKRGGSVGLVADTRVDDGESVPFFGAAAPTATAPARMALRFDAPLIPVHVERRDDARFRIHFVAPIEPPADAADEREAARRMTASFMALVEEWVRADPGRWMCTKRRWPKDRRRRAGGGAAR